MAQVHGTCVTCWLRGGGERRHWNRRCAKPGPLGARGPRSRAPASGWPGDHQQEQPGRVCKRLQHLSCTAHQAALQVIHAGLYYPEGSFKARFCSAGAARLYKFAESRHVPHWNCEKLIVAAEGLLDGNMGKSVPARLHIPNRIAGQCWATCFSAILLADKAGGSLEKHRGACKTDKLFTERRDAHIVQQLGSLRLQVRSRSSKSVNVVLAVKDDSVTSTR